MVITTDPRVLAIPIYDNNEPLIDLATQTAIAFGSSTDGLLSLTASTTISPYAHKNRKIMSTALTTVGFTNMPFEYWHWSYGDRYWAFLNHNPCALYGTVQQEEKYERE